MGVANEEDLIDDAGEPGPDQRPGPVNPVAGPGEGHHGWPECYRRVHGGSGEWTGGEDVSTDDQTNCEGCDDADLTLLRVNGGGVHRVNETESQHNLEDECAPY